MFMTLEVDDVDDVYTKIIELSIDIVIDIRDELWGDRHFAIRDPNGIGIDIVTYNAPD